MKKKSLKKHVGAIQINNKISLLERKISNVLLFNAYENLLKKEIHEIPVNIIGKLIGFNSNNIDILKKSLKRLAETIIEWDILESDGNSKEWGVTSILAEARIKNGICFYVYTPTLRKKFFHPEIYALIKLDIQSKFKTSFGLSLYENCSRYKKIGTTGWIGVDDFRRLMGADTQETYKIYKKLNEKVIKPSVEEINNLSDIKIININKRRAKRKISAVKFDFEENEREEFKGKEINKNNELEYLKNDDYLLVYQAIKKLIKTNHDQTKLVIRFLYKDIYKSLKNTIKSKGKIYTNKKHYINQTIKNIVLVNEEKETLNMYLKEIEKKEKESQIQQEKIKKESNKKIFLKYKNDLFNKRYNELSKKEKEEFKEKYILFLKNNKNNFLYKRFIKMKKIDETGFKSFLEQDLLSKKERNFNLFIENLRI